MSGARAYRPCLEALEDRCLLAASLTATFDAGVLVIEGTPDADAITVKQLNSRLSVDGIQINVGVVQVASLAWANVNRIEIHGLEGDDVIRLDKGADWNAVTKNTFIHGGDGEDTIYGGNRFDSVWGDSGNDLVYGGGGNDWLRGNDGNDRLYGQGGNDTCNGLVGDDYLHGGPGLDRLGGGAGVDTFHRNMLVPGQTEAEDRLTDGPNLTTPANDSFLHVRQAVSQTSPFMAALAATAQWTGQHPFLGAVNEDLLEYIAYDATTGLYGVPFFVNGQWETVEVSSDWNESFDPKGHLWVTLYLKAYLKASGVVYQNPDGSYLPSLQWSSTTGAPWQNASYALQTLTGQFPFWLDSVAFNPLTMAIQRDGGLKMVAISKSTVGNALMPDHAYAVMRVFFEGGVWKLTLYNPWGKDRSGPTLDGNNDGLVTLSFAAFQANFLGYSYN